MSSRLFARLDSSGCAIDFLMNLALDLATTLADFPLRCICREYPNKMDHVLNGPGDVRGPRDVHPAFYGCFDWHSSVHGHWMLVKLLKLLKQVKLPQDELIRRMIHANMSRENLLAEAAYLDQPGRESFERIKTVFNGQRICGHWKRRSWTGISTSFQSRLIPSE